jgi:hypothetical protein
MGLLGLQLSLERGNLATATAAAAALAADRAVPKMNRFPHTTVCQHL